VAVGNVGPAEGLPLEILDCLPDVIDDLVFEGDGLSSEGFIIVLEDGCAVPNFVGVPLDATFKEILSTWQSQNGLLRVQVHV